MERKAMKPALALLLVYLVSGCNSTSNDTDQDLLAYEQILEQFLDAEPFQEYFLNAREGIPDPIIIADDEIRGSRRAPNIVKFGKPVCFIEKKFADTANLGSYYWVIDFVLVDSTARMQVIDPTKGLLLSASFDLVDGEWRIYSTDVQQE